MTSQNNLTFPKLIEARGEAKIESTYFFLGNSYLFVIFFNILRIQRLVVTEGENGTVGIYST